MPIFAYVAKDKLGKIHRGRKEADNEQDVLQQLTTAGYEVTQIRDAGEPILSPMEQAAALDKTAALFISPQEVKAFTRQLVDLLNKGQLLDEALKNIAAQQQNEHLRQILVQLHRAEVEYGHSFGEAIMQCPNVFGHSYIARVRQAEQSGSFGDLIETLSVLADSPAMEVHSHLNWQTIEQDEYATIFRTKVPGGWLIKATHSLSTHAKKEDAIAGTSITFYPDPTHQWDGTSLS